MILNKKQMNTAKKLGVYLTLLKAGTEITFYFAASILAALIFKESLLSFALGLFIVFKIIEILKRVERVRGEIIGE